MLLTLSPRRRADVKEKVATPLGVVELRAAISCAGARDVGVAGDGVNRLPRHDDPRERVFERHLWLLARSLTIGNGPSRETTTHVHAPRAHRWKKRIAKRRRPRES
ncbi:hypothetical protein BURKHO8Y_210542 [Burkholderia sp. 8Y]|nr:hypothetical protein BURKHO8Y_210542 [Burkholderia sp. 8Y]